MIFGYEFAKTGNGATSGQQTAFFTTKNLAAHAAHAHEAYATVCASIAPQGVSKQPPGDVDILPPHGVRGIGGMSRGSQSGQFSP
jgi:hypothetical protein